MTFVSAYRNNPGIFKAFQNFTILIPYSFFQKHDTGEVELVVSTVKVLNPDEPYDGPIKIKEKVKKLSINDVVDEEAEDGENNGNDAQGEGAGGSKKTTSASSNVISVADLNKFASRTHTCGELTTDNIGEKVTLCGWLEFQRMDRFFILRDGYGSTQVLLSDKVKGLEDTNLTLETVLKVTGTVIPRPTATINPKMKTGHIEVEAETVELLNAAKKNLPFEVRRFNRAGERLRLTHRYLDLR